MMTGHVDEAVHQVEGGKAIHEARQVAPPRQAVFFLRTQLPLFIFRYYGRLGRCL